MIVLDTNVLSELMRRTPDELVLQWMDSQPSASLFTTTVTQIRSMTGGYPQRWPDLSGDHSATVCYLDGPWAKSPPPGPNGEVQPSFDRAVIAIADEAHADLIKLGYQETLAVTQP